MLGHHTLKHRSRLVNLALVNQGIGYVGLHLWIAGIGPEHLLPDLDRFVELSLAEVRSGQPVYVGTSAAHIAQGPQSLEHGRLFILSSHHLGRRRSGPIGRYGAYFRR